MSHPRDGRAVTPAETFERLIRGVCAKDWDGLPGLYAEDAHVVHPLGDGGPLVGRAALRRHFAAAADLPIEMEPRNITVHETADPEVVIGEFEYHGRVTTTGRAFTVPNIFVLRVRDGLVVESRDYAAHGAFRAALAEDPA